MILSVILCLAILMAIPQFFLFARSLFFTKVLYPRVYLPRFRGARRLPSVHLVVPCKGRSARLEAILRAFATQEYPGTYRLTVVNESERDPNHSLLEKLARDFRHVRHVVAGRTTSCSQKNHNVLAALAGDNKSEVFAFADADVLAGRTWLRDLVRPLTQGRQWMTTGLPSSTLRAKGIPQMLHAGLTAYQAKMTLAGMGLWGGSMALWREAFEKLCAREYWARTVVDDITLFQLVQRHNRRVLLRRSRAPRLRVLPVPELEIEIPADVPTSADVTRWFVRQILYIKYYNRPVWYAAVWVNLANYLLMFGAPLLLFFPERPDLYVAGQVGLAYLLFMQAINLSIPLIRRQRDSSLIHWLKVTFVGDTVANIALQLSVFLGELTWSGIRYKLARDGTVEEVIHAEQAAPASAPAEAFRLTGS